MRYLFLVSTFIVFLFSESASAQNKSANPGVQVYKISNYSVETDKLIQKEFKNDPLNKIVFTCIPAGIVVVESKETTSVRSTESLSTKFEKVNPTLHAIQLQGLTLKDAEMKCSQARSIN